MIACLLGTLSEAKTINLTGSWKETRRSSATKDAVNYTDTVRIDFLIGNEYVWQKDMGFMNRGTYKLTPTTLDMGARFFSINRLTDNLMVLRNDVGIYEFTRYKKRTGEDNDKAQSSDRANKSEATGVIKKENLAGNWEVYKRTSSVTLAKIDYTRILKTATILYENGNISGSLKAAEMKPGSDTWNILRYENQTIYCSGPDERTFKVLQATSSELVLEEANITYFFKQFK